MVDRICISINNRCNLNCDYCHFHEKKDYIETQEMNVYEILDNVIEYSEKNEIQVFKIGFVGNGEPLLDFDRLKEYIIYISKYLLSGKIAAYTITNGLLINEDILDFLKKYNVNVGFSIDGIPEVHNSHRCGTHKKVMDKIELFKKIFGYYPTMNCTVGRDVLEHKRETIDFFEQFDTRVTFSRMIGSMGITLKEFKKFIDEAKEKLNVRTGGYDCTMYGGFCGAGINNFYFANNKVFICGNCVDLEPLGDSGIGFEELGTITLNFDRNKCYKEIICE